MATRKGYGKGKGKGYKNMMGKDPVVHSMSAKGIKQPQKVRFIPEPFGLPKELQTKDKFIETETDLQARFDSRGSFYGKAKVKEDNKRKTLISYSTEVAYIDKEKNKAVVKGSYSATTNRHIKEFLKQNGFFVDSTKQVLEDYGLKEISPPKGWEDTSKTFSDGSQSIEFSSKDKKVSIHDESFIGSGWVVSATSLRKDEPPQLMSDTNNTKEEAYKKAIMYMKENK